MHLYPNKLAARVQGGEEGVESKGGWGAGLVTEESPCSRWGVGALKRLRLSKRARTASEWMLKERERERRRKERTSAESGHTASFHLQTAKKLTGFPADPLTWHADSRKEAFLRRSTGLEKPAVLFQISDSPRGYYVRTKTPQRARLHSRPGGLSTVWGGAFGDRLHTNHFLEGRVSRARIQTCGGAQMNVSDSSLSSSPLCGPWCSWSLLEKVAETSFQMGGRLEREGVSVSAPCMYELVCAAGLWGDCTRWIDYGDAAYWLLISIHSPACWTDCKKTNEFPSPTDANH